MDGFVLDHSFEIIAVLVAILVFWLQRRRKLLTYAVITNSSVVSVSDKVKDRIKLVYDGRAVSDLHLLELQITNAGNLPITPADYVEPLAIHHARNAQVFAAEVLDKESLGVSVVSESSDHSKTTLSRTMLNPGDSFVVKILLGEGGTEVSVTGRIVGLSRIERSAKRGLLSRIGLTRLVALIIMYVAFIAAFAFDPKYNFGLVKSIGVVSGFFLGMGILGWFFNQLSAYDKRHNQ